MTRTFALRDILSVTTGYIITQRNEDDTENLGPILDLFHHMTGERPQDEAFVDRFAVECRPYLYAWFPELRRVADLVPNLNEYLKKARFTRSGAVNGVISGWIEAAVEMTDCKAEYDVPRICDRPID